MDIVAALFIDDIELRQVPGPSTRIDLTGVQFSAPAPGPVPVTSSPHLVRDRALPRPTRPATARSRCLPARRRADRPQRAAARRSSRASSTTAWCGPSSSSTTYGTVEAHCRIDLGPVTVVPYTLLPPVDSRADRLPHAVRRRPLRAPAGHPRHRRGGGRAARAARRPARPRRALRHRRRTPARSRTSRRPCARCWPRRADRGHRGRRCWAARGRSRSRPAIALWAAVALGVRSGRGSTSAGGDVDRHRRAATMAGRLHRARRATPGGRHRPSSCWPTRSRSRSTTFLDALAAPAPGPDASSAGWPRPASRPGGNRLVLDDARPHRRRGRRAPRPGVAGHHRRVARAAARSASRLRSPGPSAT